MTANQETIARTVVLAVVLRHEAKCSSGVDKKGIL